MTTKWTSFWGGWQKKRPRATLIATCRRRVAGGKFRGTIAQQLAHLAAAVRSGCGWYDLEIESSSRCPLELLDVLLGEGRRIASAHFFGRSPRNLRRVAEDLSRGEPDAIKIAVQCDSLGRSLDVLRLARGRQNVIAVPMGDVAQPARLLASARGQRTGLCAGGERDGSGASDTGCGEKFVPRGSNCAARRACTE